MTRKMVFILTVCFLFATIVVITLYATTRKVLHERNSFIREYARMAAIQASETDLAFNSYYFAGITSDYVYLGNATAPFHLLVVNHTLTDTQQVKLHIKGIKNPSIYKAATVKIDSPYFYLADGHKPALYRGRLGQWSAEPYPYDSGAYFSQIVPIGNTSFAIRTNAAKTLNNVLGKVQKDSPTVKLNHNLLQRQVDGIFCCDGSFIYNQDLNRLIYTYYYRNEFIVCDTNMNLDYRGHTIDTFSRAQMKVGYISSNNTNKLLEKKTVNLRTATSGNFLFVNSNLRAKNDNKDRLEQESVIDVYNLTDGTYGFSFRVPHCKYKYGIREFVIYNRRQLFVLCDQYLQRHDLKPEYFILNR